MTVTQLPGTAYCPGDPSPCCDDERLFEFPWEPGLVTCPGDGTLYPAAAL
jgi:hypothetical protein